MPEIISYSFFLEEFIEVGEIGQIVPICHGNGLNTRRNQPAGEGNFNVLECSINMGDTKHVNIPKRLELDLVDCPQILIGVRCDGRTNEDLVVIIESDDKNPIAILLNKCFQRFVCHTSRNLPFIVVLIRL